MIELIIFLVLNSILNILTFYVMHSITEKRRLNPVRKVEEAVKKRKEEREIKEQQSKMSKMLQNIDNYNGTARGQQDLK